MALSLSIDKLHGGQPAGRYEVVTNKRRLLKLGKLPRADVRIDEPAAGRLHAVIEVDGRRAVLRDMGTLCGTLLNGERVTQAELYNDDEIRIGETLLRVSLAKAPTQAGIVPPQRQVTLTPPPPPADAFETAAPPPPEAPPQSPAAPPPLPAAFAQMPVPPATAAPQSAPSGDVAGPLGGKLAQLSATSLAQVEAYVDYLSYCDGTATPSTTWAVPAPAAMRSFEHVALPRSSARGFYGVTELEVSCEETPVAASTPNERVEKYDTRRLVAQIRRERRRNHSFAVGAAVAVAALVVLPLTVNMGHAQSTAVPSRRKAAPVAVALPPVPTAPASPTPAQPAPAATTPHAKATAKPAVPATHTYVVQRGDTLGSIAAKLLGSDARWKDLAAANRSAVPDPSRLEVGTVLTIPVNGEH